MTLVIAAVLLGSVVMGPELIHRISSELNLDTGLQEEVRKSIEQTLADDPSLSMTAVRSFSLVHKTGNQYEGLLEVATGAGMQQKLLVDVTYDGENVFWHIR